MTTVDAFLPKITSNLERLAGTPMQPKLTLEHVPSMARKHAQVLAFMDASPEDISDDPLIYCAEIDYAIATLQAQDDGTLLNFFAFIGRPLKPAEFTAWFFSKP
jgi:hypothetical protein